MQFAACLKMLTKGSQSREWEGEEKKKKKSKKGQKGKAEEKKENKEKRITTAENRHGGGERNKKTFPKIKIVYHPI